jgi:hypothetical protein
MMMMMMMMASTMTGDQLRPLLPYRRFPDPTDPRHAPTEITVFPPIIPLTLRSSPRLWHAGQDDLQRRGGRGGSPVYNLLVSEILSHLPLRLRDSPPSVP